MTLPLSLRMATLAAAMVSTTLLCSAEAHATGSLSEGAHQPLEQRIVLSVGPTRTS